MKLLEKEKIYCSQGDTSGKHIPKKVFNKANGCFLFDSNEKRFLDMQMFNSAANFGYQRPEYKICIEKSLNQLPCLAGEFMSESRINLSEKMCSYIKEKYGVNGRIHFTVGGAQAVDDALKLAINFNSKRNIFAFEGGYHGRTMAASSVSSSYRYTKQFGSVLNTTRIPFPNCSSCVYNKESSSCDLYCLKQFERMFESEFSGVYDTNSRESSYSAFILEPVLGRGGYVFPHPNYLSKLVDILHKHNILVIADEVQMGLFRTGSLWSFENYNIVPDIIVFGKAITNGLWPLSGVWAKEEIISPNKWPTGSTHCTFAGHPIATSLGLCTFEIIESTNFKPTISKSAKGFNESLINIAKDYDCIGRIQFSGHAAGMDIVNPKTKKTDPIAAHKLVEYALNVGTTIHGENIGLILTAGGMFNSQLMLSPCLFITEQEINLFEMIFRDCLDKTILE